MSEGSQDPDVPQFVQIIRGWPFPRIKRFTKKNIEDAMDLEPAESDMIIASYPKTGTTWIQYIVLQILSKGEYYPSFDDATFKVVPYVEMVGVDAVLAQSKPRFYKHHIPYNLVKKNNKSKVIYIYRNPQDIIASFYHFIRDMESNFPLDFNHFFDNFVAGKLGYGSYFRHVLSFYEHRNDSNLLMVSYEKLHVNRKEEILRVAEFLGEEHHQRLLGDEELLHKIILHTSFDYMKQNLTLTHPDITAGIKPKQPEGNVKVNFFRKGIVGDGKAALSDKQRQVLKEAAVKVLKGTSIISEWYHDEI